jgi:hypothetical protein
MSTKTDPVDSSPWCRGYVRSSVTSMMRHATVVECI